MRVDGNFGRTIAYEPNTKGAWQEQPEYAEPVEKLYGDANRWNYREDDSDYFTQPGDLFRLLTPEKQQLLFANTARNINGVSQYIIDKHIDHCTKADPAYGAGVKAALEAVRAGQL
ncbi:Catalase [compost metagenome]